MKDEEAQQQQQKKRITDEQRTSIVTHTHTRTSRVLVVAALEQEKAFEWPR